MMLTAIVLIFTVVSIVSSDDPQKCCTDRQFQVTLGRAGATVYPLTGNTAFIDGFTEMAYDYYRKRIGSVEHVRRPDGSMQQTTYLQDYATKRLYTYKDGKCVISTIVEMDEIYSTCIPANATFLGSATLGYGTETLVVNSWEFDNRGQKVKLGVTDKSCVPVVMASYGTDNGVTFEVVDIYSNFQPGITDPHALDDPSPSLGCVFANGTAPTTTNSPGLGKRGLF